MLASFFIFGFGFVLPSSSRSLPDFSRNSLYNSSHRVQQVRGCALSRDSARISAISFCASVALLSLRISASWRVFVTRFPRFFANRRLFRFYRLADCLRNIHCSSERPAFQAFSAFCRSVSACCSSRASRRPGKICQSHGLFCLQYSGRRFE